MEGILFLTIAGFFYIALVFYVSMFVVRTLTDKDYVDRNYEIIKKIVKIFGINLKD
jgi:hypothetical protein